MVITGFTNCRLQKYFNLDYEVNKLVYSKAITAQTKNLFENDFNRMYNKYRPGRYEGAIESEGNVYAPKQLFVAKDSTLCEFTIQENSTIYIFGGEPFLKNDLLIGTLFHQAMNSLKKQSRNVRIDHLLKLKEMKLNLFLTQHQDFKVI